MSHSSAQPMPGLSKRAQALLAPKHPSQMPPKSTPRHDGTIPQAYRRVERVKDVG